MRASVKVYYSGTVQGVGFRWTVMRLSAGFSVCGSVKNLADGRVLLKAEGDKVEVDRFLVAIKQGSLSSYIRDAEIIDKEYEGFNSFTIDY